MTSFSSKSTHYKPPFWAFNRHLQTIIPSLFRKAPNLIYSKENFVFEDGDFTQLNFLTSQSKNLAIIIPGMESNAEREYVRNLASRIQKRNWNVLIPDHRSCGDKMNNKYRSYHSGNTSDLREIIDSIAKPYKNITLIGFSLGGNITLKYLGEKKPNNKIIKAFAISTPLDLAYSSQLLEKKENAIYSKRFMRKLKKRLFSKQLQFPNKVKKEDIIKLKTLKDFDNLYTSQAHGFKDADEFYKLNSSINFIDKISTETHIINAQNDPMIFLRHHEVSKINSNKKIFLHLERAGGHVGFPKALFATNNYYENLILRNL